LIAGRFTTLFVLASAYETAALPLSYIGAGGGL
jgi:hypothetical protein